MTTATSALFPQVIAHCSRFSMGYVLGLAQDIPSERWGDMAIANANHPAFIYAHLAIYPNRVFAMLGREELALEGPVDPELVGSGSICEPDGSIYPSKAEILPYFTERYEAAAALLETLQTEDLAVENPIEGGFREKFPTLGSAVSFMMNNHIMMHAGQVSTWRRAIGLGSLM